MNKNYYAVIPAAVRYSKNLKANAKLLYGEITALCNEEGYCWASNSYFSELYGVSIRIISEWISMLEKNRFIRTEIIYKEGSKEIKERRMYIVPIHQKVNTPMEQMFNTPMEQMFNTPMEQMFQENNTVFNNYSSSSNRAEPKNEIFDLFENSFARPLTNLEMIAISDSIKNQGEELVRYALELSVEANKISMRYINGILRNWKTNNITSKRDAELYAEKRKRKAGERKKAAAASRAQRSEPIRRARMPGRAVDVSIWEEFMKPEDLKK